MGDWDFDPAAIDLGKRFLAATGLSPRGPGRGYCLVNDPQYLDAVLWMPSDRGDWNGGGDGHPVPDLRDPGTLGVAMRLVRQRVDHVSLSWSEGMGRATLSVDTGSFGGPSWTSLLSLGLGDCCVQALEANRGR